ncbi:MAG: winged helix-turn-helix transcriptional regulator [Phycisphaerae bacterium]|jgi:ArsR family transcriptional regulator
MEPRPRHSRQRYEARARIAKALAHPSRLMILEALENREMCVCDLTELVGADQSTVSKHLAVLKQAGLVADRKEGVMVYYKLKVCCLKGFWECIETVLAENLKLQQAVLQ